MLGLSGWDVNAILSCLMMQQVEQLMCREPNFLRV